MGFEILFFVLNKLLLFIFSFLEWYLGPFFFYSSYKMASRIRILVKFSCSSLNHIKNQKINGQCNLASMDLNRNRVKLAIKWYKKPAIQENLEAQKNSINWNLKNDVEATNK